MNNDSVFAAVSNFEPIPQLLSPHADIKLVFLSGNDIVFSEETIDPWYSARQRVPSHYSRSGNTSSESVDVYSVDAAASVLGCTQQFQLCNPNLPLEEQCTPPATFADIFYNESTWSPEGGNFKALERLVIKLLNFDPTSFVASIGITSLTSRYGLAAGIQGPLPDNQWQLDVEHWFKGSLAQLQQDTVEYATGPPDPAIREFIRSDDNLYNCKNQVSKPTPLSPATPSTTRQQFPKLTTGFPLCPRPHPENPHHSLHQLQHLRPLPHARPRRPHHPHLLHPRAARQLHPEEQAIMGQVLAPGMVRQRNPPAAAARARRARPRRHLAALRGRRPAHRCGRTAWNAGPRRPGAPAAEGAAGGAGGCHGDDGGGGAERGGGEGVGSRWIGGRRDRDALSARRRRLRQQQQQQYCGECACTCVL